MTRVADDLRHAIAVREMAEAMREGRAFQRGSDRRHGFMLGRGRSFGAGGGGGAAPPADFAFLNGDGTFVRNTAATYLTAATTLAHAIANARRIESRGDGFSATLIERASTNYVPDNRTGASWGAPSGATRGTTTGLDGAANSALSLAYTSGVQGQIVSTINGTYDANAWAISVWASLISGGPIDSNFVYYPSSSSGGIFSTISGAAGWQRFQQVSTALNGLNRAPFLRKFTGGVTATVGYDFLQNELGRYATSAIVNPNTTATAITRDADEWTWAAADVDVDDFNAAHTIRFAPYWVTANLAASDERWLYTFDGSSNGLRVRNDAGTFKIEAVQGGVVRAEKSFTLTTRHAVLTATVDPVGATIGISGATTGDGTGSAGTAWAWTCATGCKVGGVYGTTGNEIDGRIELPVAA